jgi:hypothetical protein
MKGKSLYQSKEVKEERKALQDLHQRLNEWRRLRIYLERCHCKNFLLF